MASWPALIIGIVMIVLGIFEILMISMVKKGGFLFNMTFSTKNSRLAKIIFITIGVGMILMGLISLLEGISG